MRSQGMQLVLIGLTMIALDALCVLLMAPLFVILSPWLAFQWVRDHLGAAQRNFTKPFDPGPPRL